MDRLFDIIASFKASDFNFERPQLLWLLLLPVLFILLEYFPKRKNFDNRNILKKFVDVHLIKYLTKPANLRSNFGKTVYFSIIFTLLVFSIANPRWDYKDEEIFRPNINIVILMDVSKSMLSQDEKPNRLERAKQEMEDIINNIGGASIGLIAFADNAHIIAPVTDDKNAIKYFLSAIDPGIFNERGSRIDKGMDAARSMLKPYKDGNNYIIILSDGGFETKADYSEVKKVNDNTTIMGMGFGGDELAPIPDDNGGWIKDETGKMVTSKLERDGFLSMMDAKYFIKATYLDDDTKQISKIVEVKSTEKSGKARTARIWNDKFYIPLILAMLMLLFKFRRNIAFPLIVMCLLAPANSYSADAHKENNSGFSWERIKKELAESFPIGKYFKSRDQLAKDNFETKNYSQAVAGFKDDYNKGVAEYKSGNLKEADSYFSKNPQDANSDFNSGNSKIFSGDVEGAIKAYEAALKINPSHQKAQHNLEIAKKILEKKKQKEEQEKQQQQNQQQNKKDKNKKNKDKNKQDQKNSQEQQGQQEQNKGDKGDNNQSQQDQQGQKGEQDKSQQDQQNNQSQDKNNKDQQQNSGNSQKPEDKKNAQQNEQSSAASDKQGENKDNQGNKPQDSNNSSNNEKQQDGLNNGTPAKQNNGSHGKSSLDVNAEEMMNRLKNDPSELLKRRMMLDKRKNGDDDGVYNGGNRPW